MSLLSAIAVGAPGIAMFNAVRRYRDVRRVVADQRRRRPQAKGDPLAIFDAKEVEALTTSPSLSWVRGTRFFGRQCPDPWAKDFQVEEHLWAVHANRLREMANAGTVLVDVVMVPAGGFVGVVLTQVAEQAPGDKASNAPAIAVGATVLVVALAAMAKVTLLREWRASADRYRRLASDQVGKRLAPSVVGSSEPA